jgi:hypothetical protein
MSFFRRRRSTGPASPVARGGRRRTPRKSCFLETLESRRLLARDFTPLEPNDSAATAQLIEHVAGVSTPIVHSLNSTTPAVITSGDLDFYRAVASVTGNVVVNVTNLGGDPDGDTSNLDNGLRLQRTDNAGVPIGGSVAIPSGTGTLNVAVTAGDNLYFRVDGATATSDANYRFEILNQDAVEPVGNTLGTATAFGTYAGSTITVQGRTITSPDRDFLVLNIPAGQSNQTFLASITMPAGTGAASGSNGPTNLGIRVRNSVGTIVATSNGTTTAVDNARFDVPASGVTQTYYLEVYSGSLGQVNQYDLSVTTIPRVGSISGYKWNDINGDGFRQESEPGVQGVQIFLDQDADVTWDAGEQQVLTDVNGFYTFANLPYGTYTVAETVPVGNVQTWPGAPVLSYTFDLNRDNDLLDHLDFGNYVGASVSGTKFNDLDADGAAQEVGEGGLVGWTIYVDYDNDGSLDVSEPFAVTNGSGDYTINGVLAGTYRVREVVTGGWTNSFPATVDGFGRYHELTFTSGAAFTDRDFGNWTTGQVSGLKFDDLDADGVLDGGEPGVVGFTIFVDYDNDTLQDGGEPFAVTGVGGAYTINGVNPGTWSVREVNQVGWTNSTPVGGVHSVTVSSNANTGGWNFGNWRPATINGTKINDLNANGVINGGEPGLAGWTFFVDYNNNGALNGGEPSAVSGVGGGYSITGVQPGSWRVREVTQVGWTNSFPATSDIFGRYVQVTPTSNGTVNGVDFANWTTGTVSGTKYNDVDGDGVIPEGGELGLQGWRIYVDYDNDSVWDNPAEPSAVSDVNGNYSITGVDPGNWNLREVAQLGWTQTSPAGGAPHAITVQSNGSVTNRNFGNFQLASISGQKFRDTDGDGVHDVGEPGLQGWTIFIDTDDSGTLNGVEVSTLTDVNGNYSFAGLTPGSYRIREQQQVGWVQTTVNPALIALSSGQAVTGVEFGNFQLTSISGQKFNDLDGDGVKDGGEPGIQNWQIFIDADNSGGVTFGDPVAFTDVNGNYTFANLGPGNYTVREVTVAGWTQTTSNPGPIALQSGTPVPNVDFGNFQNISISGYKYEDLDGDGTSDGNTDPGVAGFNIELIRDVNNNGLVDDVVVSTIPSGAGGAYAFNNLGPGRYFVREQTPLLVGWTQSAPVGNLYTIVASSGSNQFNQNFGNWRPGTINGTKYRDLDGDGVVPVEVGDTPLAGFTIYVDYDNDGVLDFSEPSAVSNGAGVYSITGVAPGTWRVREQVNAGYSNTFPLTADAFGRYHSVTVASNSVTNNIDFLNYEVISISGQKFNDLGTVGVKDVSDPGLAGWKIEMFRDVNNNGVFEPNQYVGDVLVANGADGAPVHTKFTDSNGNYELGDYASFVVGARYFVREVQQNGFQQTFGGVYSFVYNNASVTNQNFGNQSCNGDIIYVNNVPVNYVAPRVGILTVQLEGPGTVTVSSAGNFRYYTGAGTSAIGTTTNGIANPYGAGSRVDLLVDVASTQYSITVSGAGPNTKLRVINSVNVDIQSTLGLQITTGSCGDFVGVYDDPNFGTTSDAKRILVGATLGNPNSGANLVFEGVQYDAQYINALYNGNPSISKIDITTNAGEDIVRVGDNVTQQVNALLGDGNDLMRAGGGKATVYGGLGNDGVVGGAADDTFYGQNGFDVLVGMNGADRITGDADNDIVVGNAGNDVYLKGGLGNDRISGGLGADAIYGEGGADTVYRDASDILIATSEVIITAAAPDVVEQLGNQLIDNIFSDLFATDGDEDAALDTIDELMASLVV